MNRTAKENLKMESIAFNLALVVRGPEYFMNAKPEDQIPYVFCPHLPDGETRMANYFCEICLAFFCPRCESCHSLQHRGLVPWAWR
jgi:hypothetical protein